MPIVHVVVGDVILTAVDHKPKTSRKLTRLDNIARNPRVAVLFDHRSDDWETLWWVRADGRASVLPEPPPEASALLDRHPPYAELPPTGPWVRIEVDRWSGWSAG